MTDLRRPPRPSTSATARARRWLAAMLTRGETAGSDTHAGRQAGRRPACVSGRRGT